MLHPCQLAFTVGYFDLNKTNKEPHKTKHKEKERRSKEIKKKKDQTNKERNKQIHTQTNERKKDAGSWTTQQIQPQTQGPSCSYSQDTWEYATATLHLPYMHACSC